MAGVTQPSTGGSLNEKDGRTPMCLTSAVYQPLAGFRVSVTEFLTAVVTSGSAIGIHYTDSRRTSHDLGVCNISRPYLPPKQKEQDMISRIYNVRAFRLAVLFIAIGGAATAATKVNADALQDAERMLAYYQQLKRAYCNGTPQWLGLCNTGRRKSIDCANNNPPHRPRQTIASRDYDNWSRTPPPASPTR
jgi:hypothetical protein